MKISEVVSRHTIDLNVDIGEGFAFDDELLAFASSANICCGEYAGSREITLETIERCIRHRVRIGVHPGYPDREGMGRRHLEPGQERHFLKSVFDQVSWFAKQTQPAYVKPHGAFYNDTAVVLPDNWEYVRRKAWMTSAYDAGGVFLAEFPGIQSLIMILRISKLPLLGLANTAHSTIAVRAKQTLIREGFADRRYGSDGKPLPRSHPAAVLSDPAEIREQVLFLAPKVDSICLHGDTPDCLSYAELIFKTLSDAGYSIGS